MSATMQRIQRMKLEKRIAEQRAWIQHCGGDRYGYVQQYAGFDRSERDALEIFNADQQYLRRLENELERLP